MLLTKFYRNTFDLELLLPVYSQLLNRYLRNHILARSLKVYRYFYSTLCFILGANRFSTLCDQQFGQILS